MKQPNFYFRSPWTKNVPQTSVYLENSIHERIIVRISEEGKNGDVTEKKSTFGIKLSLLTL